MGKQLLLPHFFVKMAMTRGGKKSEKRGIDLLIDIMNSCDNVN